MSTGEKVSEGQIYAMCEYVQGECKKCPARIDTVYGHGQPGCHAIAEETLQKAALILRSSSDDAKDAAKWRWLYENAWRFTDFDTGEELTSSVVSAMSQETP